jgi:hypothetical protein
MTGPGASYETLLRFLDRQLDATEVAALVDGLRGDETARREAAALLLQIGTLGELASKDVPPPMRPRSPVALRVATVAAACACLALLIFLIGRRQPERPVVRANPQTFARPAAAPAPEVLAPPGSAGRALLVRGGDRDGPGAGDAVMIRHLAALGFEVGQALDASLSTEDLSSTTLLVISASTAAAAVREQIPLVGLRDAPVPIVTCETASFDLLALTGPRMRQAPPGGNGFGSAPDHTDVEIEATGHPLAAGLVGHLRIARAPVSVSWGAPASSAIKVANLGGRGHMTVQFAYERGDRMVGAIAPARRVGCFVSSEAGEVLTAEGWQLFDAGVRWASGETPRRLPP